MKLLKQFTALATASRKSPFRAVQPSHLQPIFRRLWLSYTIAMLMILITFSLSVYQLVTYQLQQEAHQVLMNLAIAASHNLKAIQQNPAQVYEKLPSQPDNDGDLDLPWQNLKSTTQSIEWFDRRGHRLVAAGAPIPLIPLKITTTEYWTQDQGLQILILPVYHGQPQQLQGYIRVSQPLQVIQKNLAHLLFGLIVGNILALLLIAISGCWLTQRSMKPIQQSLSRLQQFTADASHELRSPLTVVKTATEVMLSHPDRFHPADQIKLHAVGSATTQMTQLVEDLLILSRMDIVDRLPHRPIPLNDILEDLVSARQEIAHHLHVNISYLASCEILTQGDGNQLYRLFSNLLDNALQYTPAGGIVRIGLRAETMIEVWIEDTGIGIAETDLPHVFDRFWRADMARSYRHAGTGLGLAIAQAIAQAHGGKISVTSQLGQGSCFLVVLPCLA